MSHIIQCRICRVKFDTDQEEFVLVGQKSYYHKKCYEEWIKNRNQAAANGDEDFWKESVIDYLYRDVKMSINFAKLDNQWANFTKPERKMTPKGIYFAIRYYYDVMKGDKEKALGGIGIVPNIYRDSAQYWTDLENRKRGTLDAIIEQIKSREARPVVNIKKTEKKKDKKRFNIEDV